MLRADHSGHGVVDLTPAAFLHYARTARLAGLARSSDAVYVGHLAWQVLYEAGYFPRSAPATLRIALRAGRRTPVELVDQYQVSNPEIRQVLIDYLERRGYELSYGSLNGLATTLVRTFWKRIEQLNPGQADLRLSEATYQQWREAIQYLDDGRPRLDQDGVLVAVRALYFDVQAWATQEPERWARWVAPCPVPQREMRAGAVRRRRTVERMADRTRQRQPLLPLLVEHVEQGHQQLAELLPSVRRLRPTSWSMSAHAVTVGCSPTVTGNASGCMVRPTCASAT